MAVSPLYLPSGGPPGTGIPLPPQLQPVNPAAVAVSNMPPGPIPTPQAQPAPTPMPTAGPVNTNTPLHAAVRANPSITPQQIVDLHDKITPQGAPPLSVQGAAIVKQQALMPQQPIPPAVAQANASQFANSPPSSMPPAPISMAAANANQLAGLQQSADNMPPAAQTVAAIPTTTPQPSPVTSTAAPTPAPTTATPSAAQAANEAPPTTAPGAQPEHPSFLKSLGSVLGKAAPLIAGAVIGARNPAVGAAALGGWQQGAQMLQEQNTQKAATAREVAQQTIENQRATAQTTAATQQQSLDNRQQLTENLKGIAPESQEAYVKANASKYGVDPKEFYDANGKFQPVQPAEKQFNPATQRDAQVNAQKELFKLTKDAQQKQHDGMTPDAFENMYGLDYNAFSPGELQSDVEKASSDYAKENHWSAQDQVAADRADDYAKTVGARVEDLEAAAGLAKSRTGYIDLQTRQLVPMDQSIIRLHNAQAALTGVKATDQPGLDQSLEGYRSDLGAAAGENAGTNRLNAGTKAAVATQDIAFLAAQTGVDQARIQQITEKDPNFTQQIDLLKGSLARKQQALNNTKLDTATQKRMVDAEDVNIKQLYGGIISRLQSTGNTTAPSTQPAAGATVPTVPAIGPQVKQGKPTARSTAYRNGQVGNGASAASGGNPQTYYSINLTGGPVTLGKLTAQQYRALSPKDQAIYYHGMQQMKTQNK